MGRRHSYINVPGASSDARQSIGDWHVSDAITELKKTAGATVAEMTSYEHTVDHTLPMIFPDDVLERAKAARGLIDPSSEFEDYGIAPGVDLGIHFENSLYPTLVPDRLLINHNRAEPLLAFVEAVRVIHMQFEEVKAVLRWMNRNATPGAIRYYWPTALKLCPASPALAELSGVPQRFASPPNMSDYLPFLKTSATTVASSVLLPSNAKPRERKAMWLTFSSVTVPVGIDRRATYTTDQITYNI